MPPLANSNLPVVVSVAPVVGAAHVPKHLALEQGFDQSSAVDGDERRVGAVAAAVDGSRYELLSYAGFADQQDRRVGGRRFVDQRGQLAHGSGLSHQARAPHALFQCGSQAEVFEGRSLVVDGAPNHGGQ